MSSLRICCSDCDGTFCWVVFRLTCQQNIVEVSVQIEVHGCYMDCDLAMFTSAELHAMNRNDVKPIRSVRKTILVSGCGCLHARLRIH